MFPLIIIGAIAVVIFGFFLLKTYKARKAENLLARLWAIDNSWDIDALKQKADDVRTRVLDALERGNVEPVKDLMTGRLYNRLKGKNAEQFGFRKDDWLTTTISTTMKIVDVEDYRDDTKDRFGLYVSFVSISLGKGNSGPPDEFWVFVRDGDSWIVSDIDPSAGILDLTSSRAFSEALIIQDNVAKLEAASKPAVATVEAADTHEPRGGRREYKMGRKDYR